MTETLPFINIKTVKTDVRTGVQSSNEITIQGKTLKECKKYYDEVKD